MSDEIKQPPSGLLTPQQKASATRARKKAEKASAAEWGPIIAECFGREVWAASGPLDVDAHLAVMKAKHGERFSVEDWERQAEELRRMRALILIRLEQNPDYLKQAERRRKLFAEYVLTGPPHRKGPMWRP